MRSAIRLVAVCSGTTLLWALGLFSCLAQEPPAKPSSKRAGEGGFRPPKKLAPSFAGGERGSGTKTSPDSSASQEGARSQDGARGASTSRRAAPGLSAPAISRPRPSFGASGGFSGSPARISAAQLSDPASSGEHSAEGEGSRALGEPAAAASAAIADGLRSAVGDASAVEDHEGQSDLSATGVSEASPDDSVAADSAELNASEPDQSESGQFQDGSRPAPGGDPFRRPSSLAPPAELRFSAAEPELADPEPGEPELADPVADHGVDGATLDEPSPDGTPSDETPSDKSTPNELTAGVPYSVRPASGQATETGAESSSGESPSPSTTQVQQSQPAAAALLDRWLKPPMEKPLAGQSLSLLDSLRSAPDRGRQLAVIKAYWALACCIADYHLAVADQRQWNEMPRPAEARELAAWQAAAAVAEAAARRAELAALAAQYDLATAAGWTETSLPLASDAPFVGPYGTRFQTIFAGRPAPDNVRRIDQTLPVTQRLIEAQAAAVIALDAALAQQLDGYKTGQAPLAEVLSAWEELRDQRSALLATVRQYNHAIADYAMYVATPGLDRSVVVRMLIVDRSTQSVLRRRGDSRLAAEQSAAPAARSARLDSPKLDSRASPPATSAPSSTSSPTSAAASPGAPAARPAPSAGGQFVPKR